jgi:hypothetical protein
VTIDLTRVTHGCRRADRRVGYGRQRVQLQRALPRSLWRALRRAALWMAGRRHMPFLLTVRDRRELSRRETRRVGDRHA